MSSPPHHDVHAMSPMTPRWHSCHLWHRHGINDTIMATMTPRCPGAGKGRFCCKTMAQYGTVCNICPPHLTMTYMLCHPMTPRWHSCHLCHRHWINDTLSWLRKGYFGVKQWHNMAQYVIWHSTWFTCYVTHDSTMALMSRAHSVESMTQWERAILAQYGTLCNICPPHLTMTYMLCHPWHHDGTHVTYVTDMESMTPSWQQWHHAVLELGNGDSVVKQWHNMAQYVIYVLPTSPWRICYVTHDTTMALMSPMSQTLNQWHTVLELGKGYFGLRQWHNMAQYVIYVLPTSPWRICYVTHDTTMALMSPMSQTWNQWHHHGNNDTTLSWSWERAILL